MEERQIESVVFDKRVTRFGVKRKARKDSEKKKKRGGGNLLVALVMSCVVF